jgi:hypothetical protein
VPDNLTVTIGADSSKLRAELALVNQASKAAQKELNALATAFNKTGSDADRIKLDAQARKLDQFKRSATALNTELAKLSPTFNKIGTSAEHAASGLQEFFHQGRGLGHIISEYSTLSRGVESLGGIFGKLAGGLTGGLIGVAASRAFSALNEQIAKVRENLLELQKTAGEIGTKPIVLQAAREVAAQTGQDADEATKVLKAISTQIEEVRKKSTQQVGEAGINVLRGGGTAASGGLTQVTGVAPMTTVLRGGAAAATDFSDTFKALGINLSQFPVGRLGELQIQLLALQRFMEATKSWDPTALNIVAKGLGSTAEALKELAPAEISDLQKKIDELQKASRGATDPAIQAAKDLAAEHARLAQALQNSTAAAATALTPFEKWKDALETDAMTNFNNNLVSAIGYIEKFASSAASAWHSFTQAANDAFQNQPTWYSLSTQFDAAWKAAITAVEGYWTSLEDTVKGVFDTISGWLSSIGQSISNAAQAAQSFTSGAGAALGLGMASGGMVRGPGHSTSDNILARLSPGEYVMRAAAVRALGSGFLDALNNPGFALGGLVGRLPAFAGGGAVSGTPVHLHLGGSSFALSGHDNVVSALVVEAHRQQMRSAGTKPSWFAARPGS